MQYKQADSFILLQVEAIRWTNTGSLSTHERERYQTVVAIALHESNYGTMRRIRLV
jgi:hypothetical protein